MISKTFHDFGVGHRNHTALNGLVIACATSWIQWHRKIDFNSVVVVFPFEIVAGQCLHIFARSADCTQIVHRQEIEHHFNAMYIQFEKCSFVVWHDFFWVSKFYTEMNFNSILIRGKIDSLNFFSGFWIVNSILSWFLNYFRTISGKSNNFDEKRNSDWKFKLLVCYANDTLILILDLMECVSQCVNVFVHRPRWKEECVRKSCLSSEWEDMTIHWSAERVHVCLWFDWCSHTYFGFKRNTRLAKMPIQSRHFEMFCFHSLYKVCCGVRQNKWHFV